MRRGFTLLEVLLVVIVLAILASMLFGLMHFVESSRIEVARGRIQSLGFEVGNQVAVKGFPPATLAEAAKAIQQPEWVKDAWDNPVQYTVNGKQFKLWSFGPDGVSGTADDIVFKRN
jgi:prepilin-type N-terminal cleavage/methylation domain-containing protein